VLKLRRQVLTLRRQVLKLRRLVLWAPTKRGLR